MDVIISLTILVRGWEWWFWSEGFKDDKNDSPIAVILIFSTRQSDCCLFSQGILAIDVGFSNEIDEDPSRSIEDKVGRMQFRWTSKACHCRAQRRPTRYFVVVGRSTDGLSVDKCAHMQSYRGVTVSILS